MIYEAKRHQHILLPPIALISAAHIACVKQATGVTGEEAEGSEDGQREEGECAMKLWSMKLWSLQAE